MLLTNYPTRKLKNNRSNKKWFVILVVSVIVNIIKSLKEKNEMSSKVFIIIKFILQESGNILYLLLNYLQQIYNYDNYCKIYKKEEVFLSTRYRHNLHDHTFG